MPKEKESKTSSTSGTMPMANNRAKIHLSAKDVCDIIEASAKHKVTILKFGELQIEFGTKVEPQATSVAQEVFSPLNNNPDKEISEKAHEASTKATLVADELELRAEQIALMQIENPLLAQQLLLDGELEDDDGDDESDDESASE